MPNKNYSECLLNGMSCLARVRSVGLTNWAKRPFHFYRAVLLLGSTWTLLCSPTDLLARPKAPAAATSPVARSSAFALLYPHHISYTPDSLSLIARATPAPCAALRRHVESRYLRTLWLHTHRPRRFSLQPVPSKTPEVNHFPLLFLSTRNTLQLTALGPGAEFTRRRGGETRFRDGRVGRLFGRRSL